MALKMFELMLPAHVRPVKGWSRAAMNGGKDNTTRLQRLFRGLLSVFSTQLDHPFGPWVALQTLAHSHTVKHTHWVWLIHHGDPLLSALRQLCLHGSSGNSICCCHFGDTLNGWVNKLQMHILAHWCPVRTTRGFWSIKWTDGEKFFKLKNQ